MNFGTSEGINREGDKLKMLQKSVEDELNEPRNQLSLGKVFYKYKPANNKKVVTAKKNKKNLKNNSPWGL